MSDIGRNDPCPCQSGKKYKNCCLSKDQARSSMGLKGRKFTAKVLSGSKSQEEPVSELGTIAPVDYNLLMERSFGNALKKFPEKSPIPENPAEYLVENEEENGETAGK